MILSLMICVYFISRIKGFGYANARADVGTRCRAFANALPVLGLAVLILGGIRFGVVTPTEAGVLAVVYSWILGMFVYRSYGARDLWKTLSTAAVEAAMVGLLIGAAAPFAFVLVAEQIPQLLTASVATLSQNPYIVLLLINLLMLVFGMFLDIGAAILILTPLLMPLVKSLGIDPVHFGIVVVVNLMLGGLTPPVGMLAFITGTISNTPVHEVFRAMLPLLLALFAALMVVTYVPAVSLGLGWLIGGR
jgi:C4-dicarboxylate transporter DctM subunit